MGMKINEGWLQHPELIGHNRRLVNVTDVVSTDAGTNRSGLLAG